MARDGYRTAYYMGNPLFGSRAENVPIRDP